MCARQWNEKLWWTYSDAGQYDASDWNQRCGDTFWGGQGDYIASQTGWLAGYSVDEYEVISGVTTQQQCYDLCVLGGYATCAWQFNGCFGSQTPPSPRPGNDQSTYWVYAVTLTADPGYWSAIESVVSYCEGGICASGSDKSDPMVCAGQDGVPACDSGANGCSFTLNRFAPQLVYVSQLRAQSILEATTFGNGTSRNAAVAKLIAVQTVLTSLMSALPAAGPTSSYDLVKAQVQSLQSTIAAVGAMSSENGFVPTFSLQFYQETGMLTTYMKQLQTLISKLTEAADSADALTSFSQYLSTEATAITGQQNVLSATQDSTVTALSTALAGMSEALLGLNTTGQLMKQSGTALKSALKAWEKEQETELIVNLCFAVGELVLGIGSGAAGLVKDFTEETSSATKVKDILSSLATVGQSTSTVLSAVDAFKSFSVSSLGTVSSAVYDQAVDAAAALTGMGVQAADLGTTDTSAALVAVATQLDALLPNITTGFWSEYVVNIKSEYNDYLTGYDSTVNGAAQDVVDQVDAQSSYGNAFVTEATRFVAAVQQYVVNNASSQALISNQKALNQTYNTNQQTLSFDLATEATLAVQISGVAMQMYTTIQQMCQTFAFQQTTMYQQCAHSSTSNLLRDTCSAFRKGSAMLQPFAFKPCGTTEVLASQASTYFTKWSSMYESVEKVTSYVLDQNWGAVEANVNPFLPITLSIWDPPQCDASKGKAQTRTAMCEASSARRQLGLLRRHPPPPSPSTPPPMPPPPSPSMPPPPPPSMPPPSTPPPSLPPLSPPSVPPPPWTGECTIKHCSPEAEPTITNLDSNDTSCVADGGSLPEGSTCCQITEWVYEDTCTSVEKPSGPFITRAALESFMDPSSDGWGNLSFSIDPSYGATDEVLMATLNEFNELFVSGMSLYLEGAEMQQSQVLLATLVPTGQMTNRVLNSSASRIEECEGILSQDEKNLCRWDNYTFNGAPAGSQSVSYQSMYNNPVDGVCSGNLKASVVFSSEHELMCGPEGDTACFSYCTDENYQSLNRFADQPTTPFSLASVYGTFTLSITNSQYKFDPNAPVGLRSYGIDLTNLTAIHLGLWVYGTQNTQQIQCSDISDA